jgi:hypothetical protein
MFRFLEDVIHGVETMQKKPQGFRAHIKEFIKSGGVQDKIAEYQKNIQEICSRLKVGTPNLFSAMILIYSSCWQPLIQIFKSTKSMQPSQPWSHPVTFPSQ